METSTEKWEMFCDDSYYHLWAVRRIGDKDFNSPQLFHFSLKEDAEQMKALLEKSFTATKTK